MVSGLGLACIVVTFGSEICSTWRWWRV